MLKRSLSFLLALMLCLSMVPVNAMALDLGAAAAVGSSAAAEAVAEETAEDAAADGVFFVETVTTESELRSALNEESVSDVEIPAGVSITLSQDLTISAGKLLSIAGSLTVPKNVTLTVSEPARQADGTFLPNYVDVSGTLNIKGTLINEGQMTQYGDGKMTVSGSWVNDGIWSSGLDAVVLTGSYSGVGTWFSEEMGQMMLGSLAELEKLAAFYEKGVMFRGAELTKSVTLDEDVTVGSLEIPKGVTLTVPKGITLEGDVVIDGTLVVKGTLVCGWGELGEEGVLDLTGTYKQGQSQWTTAGGLVCQVNDSARLATVRSLQAKGVPVGMTIGGHVTLDADISLVYLGVYTLSGENVSLTIPAGVTLECDGGMDVYGDGGATATICINGTLKDYGEYFLLGDGARLTGSGRCEISGEMSIWGDASVADTLTIVQMLKAPVISISCVAASGKPRLTWNAVGGAEKYEVWRAYSKNGTYYKMGSTSGTGYTNLDAVAGKTYYYKVRAVSADGNVSDFSGVKNMTCDYARPVVSIGCDGSSGKPTLSWKAVSGATKYEIWRATGAASGTYTKLGTVTETTYADASAEAGSTYYYKVRALGRSSYATSAFSTVKAITCCEKPSFSIKCKTTTGKPVLSWEAVEGAAKYEVWRAYRLSGTYYKMGSTTGTTYTNTSAKANTTYYYKIRAIDANGNYASAFSKVKNMTCDCAMPVVTASTNEAGKPTLTWKAVDGAVEYTVWRAYYRNGTYEKMYTTTGTSYTNTVATSGQTYYYKVRAIGSSYYAMSAYSSIVSAKCK